MRKVMRLNGPRGIFIKLDADEVVPHDPGAGTPAMVYLNKGSATYWCALDTGELDDGRGYFDLDKERMDWLDSQSDVVEEFVQFWTDKHSEV